MNKKLIVIGIAVALAAPLAAQAGVEVYGDARASLDYVNNNDNTAGQKDSTFSLSSNYSNIGFKGDEDLGAGLTALWQVEQEVDFDTGNWGTKARDTYVGIAGGFGSVLAGHMRTPYRAATTRLDPFADTRGDSSAIIGSTGSLANVPLVGGGTATFLPYGIFNDELRASNAISYMTPDLSGFSAALMYVFSDYDASVPATALVGGGSDDLPKTSAQDDRNAYSLSVAYDNGPIFATAAYESLSKAGLGGGTGTPDAKAYKIGGSYTIMDATTIGALFENIDLGGTTGDRNAWSLNVAHKIGSTTLMAAYTMADDNSTSSSGASQYAVGVKQALSKNTEVYALWTQVSNDDNAAYSLDNTPGVVAGQDMSAFSLGVNVKFSSK